MCEQPFLKNYSSKIGRYKRVKLLSGFVAIVMLFTSILLTPVSNAQNPMGSVQATQNLFLDPWGRVVDVVFDQDHALTAPWDRYRFDINIVQPLARDSGAFLGDLTGDDTLDLILTTFDGHSIFFPGVNGSPHLFGDGIFLKTTTTNPTSDPFRGYWASEWVTGDIGDLDGDGTKDIVIGKALFVNNGTPSEPQLDNKYTFPTGGILDPRASLGDLNGDGKLDVIIIPNPATILDGFVYWNNSTPGSFNFSKGIPLSNEVSSLGDLNDDGLLDLAGHEGIYFNKGTIQTPSFDFSNPSPWNKVGGPSWDRDTDQPVNVYLKDGDGDGLLDVYASSLSSTVWQVLFYKNTGTATSHQLQYVGPIAVSSAPLNVFYVGKTTPSFSGVRPYVAPGDIDQNNLTDVLLSTTFRSTILWNFQTKTSLPRLSYQDHYTLPEFQFVPQMDSLYWPPNLFSAWTDLTGDNFPDVLGTQLTVFNPAGSLYYSPRIGSWPFTLGQGGAIRTVPSNSQVRGWGVVPVDVDLDGYQDLVVGGEDGQLLYYHNTATNGTMVPADPVPLTDSSGIPIDVGRQSWPTVIDLDGDNDLDFLVANDDGVIHKVFLVTPGSAQGYTLGSLLGASEQDPVDVTHVVGGGVIVPSLTTMDVDNDGLQDIVLGDISGPVWFLKNIGTSTSADFSLRPLTVSRTTAIDLKILDSNHIRLYFALPTTADQTVLSYHGIPIANSSVSGEVTIATSLQEINSAFLPVILSK